MNTLTIDTNAVQGALRAAAIELQAHYLQEEGETYRVEALQQALTQWLELSIESLVEDAFFHAVEGDRSYAFNRYAFEQAMKRVLPLEQTQAVDRRDPQAMQAA